MPQTTVSTKFQGVIPKEIRVEARLTKGQVFQVVEREGVISLVPERPLSALRGIAKGIRTRGLREKKDRI